jgi:hypothetical protein
MFQVIVNSPPAPALCPLLPAGAHDRRGAGRGTAGSAAEGPRLSRPGSLAPGDDDDDPGDDGEIWAPRTPRAGPALAVLGIAVVIILGGAAIALAGSGSKPIRAAGLGRLPGVALSAESATTVLSRVAAGGDPPKDIAEALVLPAGSIYVRKQPSNGLDLFSASVTISLDASPAQVVAFYRAELAHDGWTGLSVDAVATGSGTEVLARHASSDGYYWGVGAVVRPVTPSLSPALAGGGQDAPTSTLTLSLYEIDDDD